MPWKIAHKTDLLTDQEITMARAVPNVMPVLIVSNLYDMFISLNYTHMSLISLQGNTLFRVIAL
jgi:hypothetical protein